MAFYCDVRTIQTGTGTSNITVSDATNIPSVPKFLILLGINRNGAGAAANLSLSVGAATATTERWAAAAFSVDGGATSDVASILRNDACFALFLDTATIDGQLDLVSLDTNGYTLVPDDAFAADTTVLVMAGGGSDVTGAKAYTFTTPAAAGNFSNTSPGFLPTGNLFVGAGNVINTILSTARLGMGFATSSSAQFQAACLTRDAVGTSETMSGVRTDRCLCIPNTSSDTYLARYSFVSNDATGWTMNADFGTAILAGGLSVAGCQVSVGSVAMRTDTSDQPVTGIGFIPQGLLLVAAPEKTISSTNPSPSAEWIAGMASSATARGGIWVADEDATVASQNANGELSTTRIAINRSVVTPATDQGEMDFKTFDADGFTLDQITAGSAAVLIGYLALGPAAAAGSAIPVIMNQYRQRWN